MRIFYETHCLSLYTVLHKLYILVRVRSHNVTHRPTVLQTSLLLLDALLCIQNYRLNLYHSFVFLPTARFFSDVVAMGYVFPVVRMTSDLYIMARNGRREKA